MARIKDKTAEEVINEMIEAVMKVARGDYSVQVEFSGKNDDLDSLAMGLNMMTDDIRKSMEDLDRQRKELNDINIQLQQELVKRKMAEEELKRSRDFLERLTNSMWDVVFSVKMPERVIEWANDSINLMGYRPEECIGKTTEFLYQNKERFLTFGNELKSAIAAGKDVLHTEQLLKRKNGEVFPTELTTTFFREKGEVVRTTSIIRDITERKRAEEVLRESEGKWRSLAQNAPNIITIVNRDGTIQFINRSLPGIDTEQAIGKSIYDYILPEYHKIAKETIKHVFQTGGTGSYEIRGPRPDGRISWYETHAGPIEHDGQVVAVTVITTDITERKRAEETLRESEEKYIRLYESINEAVVLYNLPDLKISHWNKRYEDLHKLLLTKDIENTTISDMASIIEADDWDRAMEGMTKTLAGEPMPDIDVWELRMKDLGGKRRVLEVKSALYKEKDQVVGFQVAMTDITERKRAEEALRESEKLFRSLFDAMSEGVLLMDATGRVLQANPAAKHFMGFQPSESGEISFDTVNLEVIHPDGSPMLPRELPNFRVIKEKRPIGTDLTGLKHPDGTIFWFIVSAIPIFGSNNELSGILTTFADFTERKRAGEERESLLRDIKKINRKLEESNKALQDFAYIASHDLREPLRKISSFGSLIQDSLKGKLDEDQQENFEFMIDGAQRMQDMIDDLLTYSRLTTSAKPPQRVDLNEVIEDLKKLELATLLDETQGTIHVPEPLLPVQADPSQMHQLFQNLIGNGLKFHKKVIPPEISIRARQVENNMIRIEVEDNGIGFDEKYHEQIFVMFKRLHSREQYEGTGIGLAVCKKIVERHGGSIGVKSTPGEGSTFWFTLPRGSYSGDS